MSVKIFSQFCNFCVPAAYSCRREGGDMVGFITLRGRLSGSIRLTIMGKSTRFVLKLREKPPRGGFTVYLIDGEDFASFRFSDDSDEFSGTALFSCVRAAVSANPFGDCIAEGSIGAVRHGLQAVKARIRAASFSKERNAMQRNRHDSTQCTADLQISGHSAENSKHLSAAVSGRTGGTEPGKSGQKRRDMRPSEKKAISPNSALPPNGLQSAKSPVTEGILGKAKELFAGSGISAANGNPAENSNPAVHRSDFDADIGALCESCARSDESAAENPFPQLFPNSYWKKRQNDRRLFGKARVRGVMYGIVAVPSASRRPPAGLCGNLRRVRSNSGSWFWLGIRRE